MNIFRIPSSYLHLPLWLLLGSPAIGQTSTAPDGSATTSTSNAVAPDNTKSNRGDAANANQTADTQPNDTTDVELTQRIRRSVMADKDLSTYAHNVKIVTANGRVTLNGVVRSESEKAEIGAKAASVVGSGHVVNDLKIADTK